METGARQRRGAAADELAAEAVRWMVSTSSADWHEPSLYHGRAGILLALIEARAHVVGAAYDDVVERELDALADGVAHVGDSSLYLGLTGVAFALHAGGRQEQAQRALDLVRERCADGRWGRMFELLAGNAGVGLGALHVGDAELAVEAVTPYLSAATPTARGVNWPVRPTPSRSHHMAHGTLGIVTALAAIGEATGCSDLVELAIAGAEDVAHRNDAGPADFLVPHSDPQHRPDVVERYSLGWCNGPAGDAQAFRLLRQVTGQERWDELADRCWHTITTSGLPRRTRPGFWDNNGSCCGTAGVLTLACDRIVERGGSFDFADVLVDDLSARAIVDDAGARWSNHEHRVDPPELEPRPGWAMGNAGIVRELLRYSRLCQGEPGEYAVDWPDHPAVVAGR